MKKLIVFSLALILSQVLYAQKNFQFGPRVSLASSSIQATDLTNPNTQELVLAFKESNSSVQLGAFARVKLLGIYAQPEVLIGSTSIVYTQESPGANTEPAIRTEKAFNVNMPLMFGMKLGPIRLQGGPVYSFVFGEKSDLLDLDGYQRQFDKKDFDVRLGAGVDLGPVILDLTYQLPLSATQNLVTIDGFDYQIANPKGHLVGSLGFAF